MLPKLKVDIDKNSDVYIRKFCNESDVTVYGAFEYGAKINFEITVSRRLGASGTVLRICRDGCADKDISAEFCGSDNLFDVYTVELDTKVLCGEAGYGLFYYEILFLRGLDTKFTDTYNNFDFSLSDKPGARFKLLVYEKDYKTPDSFGEGIIYHVFVDRFCKGNKDKPVRKDAIINRDWDNGVPQYQRFSGDPLPNNMFFGGDLWGVADKLDYLASLGVKFIYLSPIFEAYSNHKYDTGDYMKVDEMFGGDKALKNLIEKSAQKGMKIILDGVFNHTGDDSVYFNRYKRYGNGGAYNDPESEYYKWYHFNEYPDSYEAWWGINILPKLNYECDSCREFIAGHGGVAEKYIKMGIGGWRLDVADELPDRLLDELRTTIKRASNGEAVMIGEVWENAVDKVAYGHRRRYFSGSQLDSVMNYPLKNAIVGLCIFGDAETLYNTLTELYSSYPRTVSDSLMNLVGTHDTERIMTVLGREGDVESDDNNELACKKLSPEERERGIKLQKIASTVQYTVYGIPSVYYGDEVGLEGYHDPFCRMPFPWSSLDRDEYACLLSHYRRLGEIRINNEAFFRGDFYVLEHTKSMLIYAREKGDCRIIVAVNMGEDTSYEIPQGYIYRELLTDKEYTDRVTLAQETAMVFSAYYVGDEK